MNEKHWGQQGLLAVMLLALICSGPNSAVGSHARRGSRYVCPFSPLAVPLQGEVWVEGRTTMKQNPWFEQVADRGHAAGPDIKRAEAVRSEAATSSGRERDAKDSV